MKLYRAVGNRCAVNFADLNLPISETEALLILEAKGFRKVEVDMRVNVSGAFHIVEARDYPRRLMFLIVPVL